MHDALDFTGQPTILVVDDTPENLALMAGLLRKLYRVKLANSGEKALQVAQGTTGTQGTGIPDLILLDIMMPGLNGYDVIKELKRDARTRNVPVIFLTAMTGTEDETRGLEYGAVDFITKPVNPPVLLARVATHLQVKAAQDFLRDQNQFLEDTVRQRTRDVEALQDVTIHAMASLAETRDNDTGNHIRRTQHYVELLARELQGHPRFMGVFDDRFIRLLFKSAPLHDIGKVGIADRILLKPGRLEPEEFEAMKQHCALGRDAIQRAERQLGIEVDFLSTAKEIAYSHQEKWDGSGYPEGLAGEAIPVSARLMAVADVYDALISRRVYKPAMPHTQAVGIIAQGRGSHFDPDMVDAFLACADRMHAIAQRFADSDDDLAALAQRQSGPA